MAVEVLTASLLESIVKGIFSILAKKMPSKEELQKARADLGRLVKLAQDTGYSLGCYFEVERAAIRAGVHATELRQFFSEGATPSSRLLESLTSLLEDRVKRGLGKDGLRKIHEFRDDFENVRRLVDATQKNLKGSISHLKDGK